MNHKTIAELHEKLQQYEDLGSAIALYKEANAIAQAYKDFASQCLALAQAMTPDGTLKQREISGVAGWTRPKAPKLDKAAWSKKLEADSEAVEAQRAFDEAKRKLEAVQADCMRLPEPRFYIK